MIRKLIKDFQDRKRIKIETEAAALATKNDQIDKLMDRIGQLPPDEQKSVDRLIDKLLSSKKGKGKDD